MTQEHNLDALARSIIDSNRFMALGTADRSGTPWVSPVWYAPLSYHEYVWVSRPGTRHSLNLAERPQVAITIYDSHRPGSWSAFYMAALAQELEDVDDALEAFNRRSEAQGLRAWSRAEVVPPGEFRLYRATASEQFVLDDHDARLPVLGRLHDELLRQHGDEHDRSPAVRPPVGGADSVPETSPG